MEPLGLYLIVSLAVVVALTLITGLLKPLLRGAHHLINTQINKEPVPIIETLQLD